MTYFSLTKHHPARVEATPMKEPSDLGILPQDWFVVWGEGLWATHGRFDANVAKEWYPVNRSIYVDTKDIPVKLIKPKGKVFVNTL